jgi:hypothetical protein
MEKEFVTYELSLRMKRLRFNEPCISFYSQGGKHNFDIQSPSTNIGSWSDQEHYCSAPLFSQAFRWFREKYNLISSINTIIYGCPLNEQEFHYKIITNTGVGSYGQFETYEEAETACLEKLIEIVEQKNKKDETN